MTRSFSTEGITFTVYGDAEAEERIIPVDCIPRILAASDWQLLEAGLTQRLRALNQFLADIYNDARILNDGVIPSEMVHGCPQYRPQMRGFRAPHGTWVAICGTDLVRTNDGFRVLEDNLRVPSGVSYMIANRKAVKASFRRLYRSSNVREVEHYGRVLLTTLRELAQHGRSDPTVALLTPGVYNSAFYEHMFLAGELDAELVEGSDLLAVDGFVYMRTTTACRRGNVTLVNAPGTGVADDKSVYAYVPDMIRYSRGEEPLLANVETLLCRRPEILEQTLENLDRLVVKRVGESGGYGMLVGPHATPQERAEYAEQVRANPADFIAQPTLALSRAKQLCRLLRLQAEALVDRPLREIRFGWHRTYRTVGSEPPPGSLEAFDSEDYTLADSYTLADHLTFDRLNPASVWSCFALGRENARQTRRCISADSYFDYPAEGLAGPRH